MYVKKYHIDDAGVRCPELWINSHGEIVDTVSRGSEPLLGIDPAEEYHALWPARRLGQNRGGTSPPIPEIDDPARAMYVYLRYMVPYGRGYDQYEYDLFK